MKRLRAAVEFAFWEFGPLILLLTMSAWFGLKVAIAVTIAFLGPLGVAVVGSRRRQDLLWPLLAGLGVYLLATGGGDGGGGGGVGV